MNLVTLRFVVGCVRISPHCLGFGRQQAPRILPSPLSIVNDRACISTSAASRTNSRLQAFGLFLHRQRTQPHHQRVPYFETASIPSLHQQQIRSSTNTSLILFVAASSLAVAVFLQLPSGSTTHRSSNPTVTHSPTVDGASVSMASMNILPGRPGNLTPEQEAKLREFWVVLLKLCGDQPAEVAIDADLPAPSAVSTNPADAATDDGKGKKKRLGMFSRSKPDAAAKKADAQASTTSFDVSDDPDDKYGLNKQYQDTLATMSPDQLHEAVWTMIKHDHPDLVCLRFLRARKWDVQKSIIMLVSAMNWRANQMHVDSDIMLKGEEGAILDCDSADVNTQKVASDFIRQLRQGKTVLHGVDKHGSPVCYTRVKLHRLGEQSEEALERYTVYLIETARMMLRQPVDTATMIFDMTGFSMANMVSHGVTALRYVK